MTCRLYPTVTPTQSTFPVVLSSLQVPYVTCRLYPTVTPTQVEYISCRPVVPTSSLRDVSTLPYSHSYTGLKLTVWKLSYCVPTLQVEYISCRPVVPTSSLRDMSTLQVPYVTSVDSTLQSLLHRSSTFPVVLSSLQVPYMTCRLYPTVTPTQVEYISCRPVVPTSSLRDVSTLPYSHSYTGRVHFLSSCRPYKFPM